MTAIASSSCVARPRQRRLAFTCLALAAACAGSATAVAAPVDSARALDAATGWVRLTPTPLGQRAGSPSAARTVRDAAGEPLFHVVELAPTGFALVAADDELETVIAFSPDGVFDAVAGQPLFDLATRDSAARLRALKANPNAGLGRRAAAQEKWRTLLARGGRGAVSFDAETNASAQRLTSISDVRVEPLTKTRWNQDTVTASGTRMAVFNYYTPPYSAGNTSNYPAGCVATAWAQIMKFHEWPTAVGEISVEIEVDKSPQMRALRGGDGVGGAYDWASMVAVPGVSTTVAERQAIGALLHDAGVGLSMSYSARSSGTHLLGTMIKSSFKYANAVYMHNSSAADVALALRTNLDAGLPAAVAIWPADRSGGHEPVVDGYGYNLTTLYHHLNMGWGGNSDAWYNLPTVDDEYYGFTLLDACTFNIMPNTRGEIVSGRILGPDGAALAGVTVTINDGTKRTATTNARGIWAVKGVASNASVTIAPRAREYVFVPEESVVRMGLSVEGTWGNGAVGNRTADFAAKVRTSANPYTPLVSWTPAPLVRAGAPLSAAHLNATADVPGTFSYAPALGTVLPIGTHTLNATFTPTDTAMHTSTTVQAQVTVREGQSQLVNIAARAYCSTGNNVTIGGFVVSGSAPKRVLVRAVGPTLVDFGLSATEILQDPVVEVHRGAPVIAENDNWTAGGSTDELREVSRQVAASPLKDTDTTSAAMLLTLAPGAYTFIVKGKNDTSGIVLLEVYDADTANTAARFVNIAARANATSGNGVTIGGFVIGGNVPKQVLLRAVGPSLTQHGLVSTEVLANPTIEVHRGVPVIAENDDWTANTNAEALAAAATRVRASDLLPNDAKSSGLLLTLEPGAYSFIAKDKNGSGIVLVEVYDAD